MTEKEKSLAGMLYDPSDPELVRLREEAHEGCMRYNAVPETRAEERKRLLDRFLPHRGENVFLQGPIQFDYGVFTTVGKNFYANFNFTVLDSAPVTIGDNVFFGPNCSVVTPIHPMLPEERRSRRHADGSPFDLEYAAPITIGNDCWFATGVTVCGGVTVGDGCVIGAGSVVTHSIPPHTFAAGVPCRPIRPITEKDSLTLRPDLMGDHTFDE